MLRDPEISGVWAREVLDCRGLPTVQVDVVVDNAFLGRADVPAGRPVAGMSRWNCATAAAASAASASGAR